MFPLFICIFAVGIPLDILSIWMKMRVNEALPEDRRLSWWSRNYWEVERIYGEQHPESILPSLSRGGGYVVIALLALTFVLTFMARK